MPSCVFRKCTNYFSKVNKSHGLTYHSFPADGVELQEWIEIVRRQRCESDWVYSKQSKICSAHFRPEDLNKSGCRTLLRKGARPRIKEYEIQNIISSELLKNVSQNEIKEHIEPPCKTALKAKVCELTKENEFLKIKNRSLITKNERLVKKIAKTTAVLKLLKKRYCSRRKLSNDLNFNNNTSSAPEDSVNSDRVQGNILCRSCGNEVASSNDLISEFSSHSQYFYRDSIFDKDEVLLQWEEFGSLFPGYYWKACLCPDCRELIGWIFEPIDSVSDKTPSTFFGILLPSLIGESFVNSLTVIPGGL